MKKILSGKKEPRDKNLPAAPEGYFEDLADRVLKNVQHLRKASPAPEEVFQVPPAYFDRLPARILKTIHIYRTLQPSSSRSHRFWAFGSAAAVIVLMVVSGLALFRVPKTQTQKSVPLVAILQTQTQVPSTLRYGDLDFHDEEWMGQEINRQTNFQAQTPEQIIDTSLPDQPALKPEVSLPQHVTPAKLEAALREEAI
jgi:hypothetical protein